MSSLGLRFGTRHDNAIDIFQEVVDDKGLVDGHQSALLGTMRYETNRRYWSPDNALIQAMGMPIMRSYRARQINDFKMFIGALLSESRGLRLL